MRYLLLILLTGCTQFNTTKECGRTQMIARQDLPLVISPSPELAESAVLAATAWNYAYGGPLVMVAPQGAPATYDLQYQYPTMQQAVTSLGWVNGKFTDTKILFNPGWRGMADEYSIMVHEIGHALGLEHSDNGTMSPVLYQGEIRGPDKESVQILQCIYGGGS